MLTHHKYYRVAKQTPEEEGSEQPAGKAPPNPPNHKMPTADDPNQPSSSKLKWITDTIQDVHEKDAQLPPNERRKVLVCTAWPSMTPIIEAVCSFWPRKRLPSSLRLLQTLNAAGITASFIDGSVPNDKRAALLKEFNQLGAHWDAKGKESWVCCVSMSMTVGLNCQRGSVVITIVCSRRSERVCLADESLVGCPLELCGL